MTSVTVIYGLSAADGAIRYIGKTIQAPQRRLRAHILAALKGGRLPVHYWIRKHGDEVTTRVLEVVAVADDWAAREKHWIAGFNSGALLNLTAGGDGQPGYRQSEDHRERRLAAIRRGKSFTCEICGAVFWRKPRDIALGHSRFCSRACNGVAHIGKSDRVAPDAAALGVERAAALRRARTKCPSGHQFSPDNTRINRRGARVCRTCCRSSALAYLARKKQVANV